MLPTFLAGTRVGLVAAADPRPEARALFQRECVQACESVEALCADPAIEAVYIVSPHQMHAAHAQLAAQAGKHVLVEKPMALTLAECQAMIEAAETAGVHLIVGHSHSFDAPIRRLREIVESGTVGTLRMNQCAELHRFPPSATPTRGAHHCLWRRSYFQLRRASDRHRATNRGGRVKAVTASTGVWGQTRPTEDAYDALLQFEDGAFASLTYNGYGHFRPARHP